MAWPISAADVRAELGWAEPSTPDADEVEVYATAAVDRIEAEIGPHRAQPVTAYARGPRLALLLPGPVTALASVIVGGVELPTEQFTLDPDAGIVYGQFPPGDIVATGTAPQGVPAVVELAARYLAATWVRQSKVGPPSLRSRGADPDTDVLQGFAMPRRVSEMIRPFIPLGGFA